MLGRFARVWQAYSKRPWATAFGFAAAVASPLCFMAIPSRVSRAIDRLAGGQRAEQLLPVAAGIVALAAASGALMFLQRRLLVGLSRHLEHELRTQAFQHLLRLPSSWFARQRVGDLLTRLGQDVGAVRMACGPALMYVASTGTVLATAAVLMLRVHAGLTLAALSMAPAVALATTFFGARIYRRWTQAQEELSRFTSQVEEHLVGLRVLRAFVCEEQEVQSLAARNLAYFQASQKLIGVHSLFYPLLQFLIGVGFVVVLGFGGWLVSQGRLSLGQFVEFNLYLARLIWPMIAVGWVANLWQRGAASMARLEELFAQPPEPLLFWTRPSQPEETLPPLSLEVREVTFTYPDASRPALRHVSFSVPAGARVVLLGEVGSGKSTLLQLIPRLWTPPPGSILVGERDVLEWPLEQLRQAAVLVPQTAFLFSATLRENITMGRPDATDEEVWEAVRQAGLSADVQQLPQGLDTLVGERGVTLSGGQRQRVALARALVLRPQVLLLDDGLSAVDRRTEKAILQALPSTTILFATHRLLVAATADWVVLLDRGEVVASGPPSLLRQSDSLWSRLLALEELEAHQEVGA